MARLKAVAREQLAEHGAAALSVRAVARELGVVSSAVYRYVASRDELLTLLIIDAYDALGDAAERADAAAPAEATPAERWTAIAHAIRDWALAHPHEYALVYGSPVPGYAAPTTTVAPATRVVRALLGPVTDAHRATGLSDGDGALAPTLRADLATIAEQLDVDLPPGVLARAIVAWTQLFGLISFELFGQTRNGITDHAAMLDTACQAMTTYIGL